MRILGIDYGAARIGMALGDTESRIASPWGVIEVASERDTLATLREIVARDEVAQIVIGVPRPLRDQSSESDQTREVRAFIASLASLHIPITEADETLSSKLAATQVAERGERGKRDDLAAAAILQSYLDTI
jgi:putative holliday junction resolvase